MSAPPFNKSVDRRGDNGGENMSLRLPPDLVEFVERQAVEQCNSRNGIIRLAIVKFREAVEGAMAQGDSSNPEWKR
jgi:hypothetical protein